MEKINYSVIIRTTGKAAEKYQSLLDSIKTLEPQPAEIIVVLPEGYAAPKETLGYERIYYCPKGMVIQRMTGIQKCKTPYALICDDDVQFGADFVEKLHEPLKAGLGGLSIAPLYSFLPQRGIRTLVSAILGAGLPTLLHKDRYVSVLRTTGYSYNRKLDAKKKYYETQSAAWTCFYADISALRSINFEAEQEWLDSHGYSALDDQTMFYKAWLRDIKTVVVADAYYVHLDAKTSTRECREPVLFSSAYNRIVFWHRYIFSQEKGRLRQLWAKLCFAYYLTINDIYNMLRHPSKAENKIKTAARQEAKIFLQSEAYRNLPPVK